MTNKEKFIEALRIAYEDLFATNEEYSHARRRTTPDALAHAMTVGLEAGAASNDGEGIKRACKACGIKTTYKAIQAFLAVSA